MIFVVTESYTPQILPDAHLLHFWQKESPTGAGKFITITIIRAAPSASGCIVFVLSKYCGLQNSEAALVCDN